MEAWPRPVPTVGDRSSAAERAQQPEAWAFPSPDRAALTRVMASRRDIRRFRADPVPDLLVRRLLEAAHQAPSVGHSQPWRFVTVRDPATRARAAALADRARLEQAAGLDPESGRQLLDLDLEGIREAPLGLVVCCDRRAPAAGVLGRATFHDADLWSCACAIQNLWLAARAEGIGVGWVTLFRPDDLAALVGAPPGVVTLGWLCIGWPDERPPDPGLERRGWSRRLDLDDVVVEEGWPQGSGDEPSPPPSRLAPPSQRAVVAARDTGDSILSPPAALGLLDRLVDKVLAVRPSGLGPDEGCLLLAASDHPVVAWGVSAYAAEVTRTVAAATLAGTSVGAVAAARSGLTVTVVDAGISGGPLPGAVQLRPEGPRGDLVDSDGLTADDAAALVEGGSSLAGELCGDRCGLVALGEVGVGNTTVAAAVAAGLLGGDPGRLVGLGAGSDSAMVETKRSVVAAAVRRTAERRGDPLATLAALGGGELAVLAGAVLGAAASGAVVVLDGFVTCVAALVAVRLEPAVLAHLVAGQRSREAGHREVLSELGLEPLLDIRLRAGEGVGASLASGLLRTALAVRGEAARTA